MQREVVPFHPKLGETKKVQGRTLDYVEWYHYVMRGTREWPQGFSSEIRLLKTEGPHLHMVVRVTNRETGEYHDGVGIALVEKPKDKGFGGGAPEAYSQGLRRAFAVHGMGIDMYMDPDELEFWEIRLPGSANTGVVRGEGKREGPDSVLGSAPRQEARPNPREEDPRDSSPSGGGPALGVGAHDGSPVTPMQQSELKTLGKLLALHAQEASDLKLANMIDGWRNVLKESQTEHQAKIVINAMRNEIDIRKLVR